MGGIKKRVRRFCDFVNIDNKNEIKNNIIYKIVILIMLMVLQSVILYPLIKGIYVCFAIDGMVFVSIIRKSRLTNLNF